MYSHIQETVLRAEAAAANADLDATLAILRELSPDDFGVVLLTMPDPTYPRLSALLPKMADEQVQRDWTGNAGLPLLAQSLDFVRSVALRFQQVTGRPLQDSAILDFGCGYGRILRLMAFFSAPDRLWGVDPWDRSIAICREDRMFGNLSVSDYLPRTLPVGSARFDLSYAFSVFTHLSERTAKLCLATLREYVADNGLLVITVRPIEYWDVVAQVGNPDNADVEARKRDHQARGYAFSPHGRPAVEGEVTYGDTSLTMEWLRQNAPGWEIAGYDHTVTDWLQIIVYLRPTAR
ncbi:class I SAM-dependent methyltransferase [Nostoc sp. NIES-2111]